MNSIKVLDVTLRDGGYVNNWEFGFEEAKSILETVYKSGVDYVEAGFIGEYVNENGQSLTFVFEKGFVIKDIKFSEICYDCDKECFCYDMTVTAQDSKGLAVLDMTIYNKSGYQREWTPAPVSEQEIRTEGCTDELKNALSEMFV